MWQPWATLMAIGAKKIETRGWSTRYRGALAIHAAKRFDREQRELCRDEPFCSALERVGYEPDDLPRGEIVGVVDLVDVLPTQGQLFWSPEDPEVAFGDYALGRYAWVTRNARRLPNPIPWRGAQGLWVLPEWLARSLGGAK